MINSKNTWKTLKFKYKTKNAKNVKKLHQNLRSIKPCSYPIEIPFIY